MKKCKNKTKYCYKSTKKQFQYNSRDDQTKYYSLDKIGKGHKNPEEICLCPEN